MPLFVRASERSGDCLGRKRAGLAIGVELRGDRDYRGDGSAAAAGAVLAPNAPRGARVVLANPFLDRFIVAHRVSRISTEDQVLRSRCRSNALLLTVADQQHAPALRV